MCGRYTLTTPVQELIDLFELQTSLELVPRYNIAPSQEVPVVRSPAPGRRDLALLQWGLLPGWAREPAGGSRWINARCETVTSKPAFRDSFVGKRCLVLADGFYEWKKEGRQKQPYYLRLAQGGPFAMAGLWTRWRGDGHDPIESCALITTDANSVVAPIHDRMPVLLERQSLGLWLDAQASRASLLELLKPYPADAMEAYPVSLRVNQPANDDRRLIERLPAPLEPVPEQLRLF